MLTHFLIIKQLFKLTPLGSALMTAGLDIEDANIATKIFASKTYKIVAIDKFGQMRENYVQKAIDEAVTLGMSVGAEGDILAL